MRRRLGSTLLLLPLLAAAAACTADGDEPAGARTVAGDLAAGLATGELGAPGLALDVDAAAAQASYDQARGELVDLTPEVGVGEVVEDASGTTATAALEWTWPVGTGWSYATEATLTRPDEDAAWTVTWGPALVAPGLTDAESLTLGRLPAERGEVTGAGGQVLVTERPVRRVGIDKTQVPPGQERVAARALAALVEVQVQPFVRQVVASGPEAFVEAITYRAEQVPPAVEAGLAAVAGGRAVDDELALAPTREFAAALLGRVGPVTAELVEAQPGVYRAGDVAGLSGLQSRYDAQLRGTPGAVVEAVTAPAAAGGTEQTQQQARELFRSEPVPGSTLALTLDPRLQELGERVLADVGPASALVALRPSTGDLLAVAHGPGAQGRELATTGQYAPGSTFKIASSLALLRSGLAPDSTVPCTPTLTVDGRVFGNYSDYPASGLGDVPLSTAVADSCNTAFISQRDRLGEGDLASAGASLGLGVDHDLGFPAYLGQVEPPASQTQAAADLIGQGTVLASPMTMAAVVGSVQQGATVVPRLVLDPAPPTVPEAPAVPLAPAEADALRGLLRGVVTSGSGRALADVPGRPVIAKTGTAEFGTGPDLQTHAWMVAAQGDLAVAVFVEVGAGGSATAGPLLEAFLRGV